jgi:sec-independent protein translocase protein TatA
VVFVALVLILGTGKLPAAARKMGRAAAEFEKAKNDIRQQMSPDHTIRVSGPVQNERQKLEAMAKSVGIDPAGMSTDELRRAIQGKIGGSA